MAAAAVVIAAWGVGATAACHTKQESATRRYALHGSILAVNRGTGNIVVKHDEIPGYMSAMTMPFPAANPQDLMFLENGDEIRAELVVTIEGAARLEHIRVLRHARQASAPR